MSYPEDEQQSHADQSPQKETITGEELEKKIISAAQIILEKAVERDGNPTRSDYQRVGSNSYDVIAADGCIFVSTLSQGEALNSRDRIREIFLGPITLRGFYSRETKRAKVDTEKYNLTPRIIHIVTPGKAINIVDGKMNNDPDSILNVSELDESGASVLHEELSPLFVTADVITSGVVSPEAVALVNSEITGYQLDILVRRTSDAVMANAIAWWGISPGDFLPRIFEDEHVRLECAYILDNTPPDRVLFHQRRTVYITLTDKKSGEIQQVSLHSDYGPTRGGNVLQNAQDGIFGISPEKSQIDLTDGGRIEMAIGDRFHRIRSVQYVTPVEMSDSDDPSLHDVSKMDVVSATTLRQKLNPLFILYSFINISPRPIITDQQ